ncbi:MAG: Hsp20/alpha crystallin family protein [Armatimonadetes bacterium]|nr:Hsp20/alpha crystallin family protein [Armatimonadota bacterium]
MVMQRWDPFSEIMSLRDAMDRLLEQSVVRPQRGAGAPALAGTKVMPVDLYQKDSDYVIKAFVPGVKAEDVDIRAERETVFLKAHVPGEVEKEEAKNYRWLASELGCGDVVRTVTLPGPIDAGRIEATVENGVLTVVVPQAEEAKPKKIEVKTK